LLLAKIFFRRHITCWKQVKRVTALQGFWFRVFFVIYSWKLSYKTDRIHSKQNFSHSSMFLNEKSSTIFLRTHFVTDWSLAQTKSIIEEKEIEQFRFQENIWVHRAIRIKYQLTFLRFFFLLQSILFLFCFHSLFLLVCPEKVISWSCSFFQMSNCISSLFVGLQIH